MECVEYVCPIIVLVIIVVLKIAIDDRIKMEKVKRILVEESVDIMSLAISFVISFLIAVTNRNNQDISQQLSTGFICFVLYILLLVITVLVSKLLIRIYAKKEKVIYLILGIVLGYGISIPCLIHSIVLLSDIGGV